MLWSPRDYLVLERRDVEIVNLDFGPRSPRRSLEAASILSAPKKTSPEAFAKKSAAASARNFILSTSTIPNLLKESSKSRAEARGALSLSPSTAPGAAFSIASLDACSMKSLAAKSPYADVSRRLVLYTPGEATVVSWPSLQAISSFSRKCQSQSPIVSTRSL